MKNYKIPAFEGVLIKDPELRFNKKGESITIFRVLLSTHSSDYKYKEVFVKTKGQLAMACNRYLKAGLTVRVATNGLNGTIWQDVFTAEGLSVDFLNKKEGV